LREEHKREEGDWENVDKRERTEGEIYLEISRRKYEFLVQLLLRIMFRMVENFIQGID
jgi:hypothetical protein